MPEPKKPLTKPAAGAKQTAARSTAATAKAKPARSTTPKTTAARTNATAKPAATGAAKAPATRKPRVAVLKPEAAVAVASVSNPPTAAVPEAMPSTAATQEETLRNPATPDLASAPLEASPEPATDAATAQPTDPQTEVASEAAPAPEAYPGIGDDADLPADEDVDLGSLRVRLTALQQEIRAAGIPVVIVFEGWDASGKGTMLSKLVEGLDPRGYQVYAVRKPSEEDRAFPPMRRYWTSMPAKGNISLFCGSWYREVTKACYEGKTGRKRLNQRYSEIMSLESQLVCDGTLLLKFFLHIPRKEQKSRLKELESKKSTRWRVDKDDWFQNEHYEEYLRLYDAMIARTHFDGAAWHVLRSDNRHVCIKQIYDTVISAFETALANRAAGDRSWDTPFLPHVEESQTVTFPPLDTFDPEQALVTPYKPAIDKAQKHLRKLQDELYRRGIPLIVCFEGWDAAGKGGTIRRLTASLDARAYDVVPIAAPTPLELSHHYLWRFWDTVPRDGTIAIFDRTWYGRVMVERVEGLCTEPQWKRAYEEINRFEADLVNHGAILCKFWLHIDPDTQLTRFRERESTEDKSWKITSDDWRNREKWPQYAVAVDEMLQKTNTAYAPWTVVEANNKQYARLKVLQTVIHAVECALDERHG